MIDEVRKLSAERAQLMSETTEERKKSEADRESVRAEMEKLRQGVSEACGERDSAVAAREDLRSADLYGMERAVSDLSHSHQASLRAGLQEVLRGRVDPSSVGAGLSDGPV